MMYPTFSQKAEKSGIIRAGGAGGAVGDDVVVGHHVPVPKDLSKIKTKLAFNLTKRQLVCFSSAAAVGLPAYLFSRGSIGNSAAMFLMIGLMLPFFFLAMYERDGLPLEKVLKNIIRTRFLYPRVRPYKTENFYALLSARKEAQPIAKQQKGRKARRQKA